MANPYFNAEYYLAQNPDVFAAGINTAEGAWEHYVNFGAAEALNGATSRKPAPWFDVSYYLTTYPDLNTSGLTAGQLFDHFTTFGIDEDRQPSADAVITEAGLLAYAKANEDLMEAFGIEEDAEELTDEQADALTHHFYAFGYQEERDGAPFTIDDSGTGQTFTLTTGVDNWTGTAKDDVVQGILTSDDKATLNTFDSIDGAGGANTLNLVVKGGSLPTNTTIKNIQTVNVLGEGAALDTIDASKDFGGQLKELWQVAEAGDVTGIGNDQVIGFRNVDLAGPEAVTITGAKSTTALTVALDDVAINADLNFRGDKVNTVNVSGSLEEDGGLVINLTNKVKTLNLDIENNVGLRLEEGDASGPAVSLVTLNASGSTGGITLDAQGAAALALETATFGSGVDVIAVDQDSFKADEVAVELGAGNDQFLVALDTGAETAISITGGAGRDTFSFDGGNVVVDANLEQDGLEENLVTITDFGNGRDILELDNGASEFVVQQDVVDQFVEDFLDANDDAELVDLLNAFVAAEADGGFGLDVNGAVKFNFGDDAYVFINTATDDTIIQLAGVSHEVLTSSNVVFVA